MWTWISNQDLKTLLQGVAGVSACGLILGAAMHPTLDVGDRPGGPQILMSGGGPRGSAEVRHRVAYAGQPPEYVIGTDWTRPPAVSADPTPRHDDPAPPAEQGETVVFTSDDELAPLEATRAAWRDAPREEPYYPSARGGAYYDSDLPEPPPAPDEMAIGEG